MKLIGVLVVMMAMAFGDGRPCAHALFPDGGGAAHEMAIAPQHAEALSGMAHEDYGEVKRQYDHCPDDCQGDDGCKGCSGVSAVIDAGFLLRDNNFPGRAFALNALDALQSPLLLDPPPPKRASLI